MGPWLCSPSCCSVHGILQARILKWVAISILQGISTPQGLNLQGDSFTCWVIKEAYTPNLKRKRKIFIKRNRKQSSLRLLCDTQCPGDKGTMSTFMSQVKKNLPKKEQKAIKPETSLGHSKPRRQRNNVYIYVTSCESIILYVSKFLFASEGQQNFWECLGLEIPLWLLLLLFFFF